MESNREIPWDFNAARRPLFLKWMEILKVLLGISSVAIIPDWILQGQSWV